MPVATCRIVAIVKPSPPPAPDVWRPWRQRDFWKTRDNNSRKNLPREMLKMNYRTLGKTGLKVSEISFGAWAIGGTSEAAGTQWGWVETSEADAIAAIRRARDLGVNFFDTADVYGNGRSEEVLGKALSSEWDKVYVASKVGNVVRNGVGGKDWSRQHIVRS